MRGDTCRRWVLLLILAAMVSGLQGCVSWPKEARGGLAELQPAHDPLLRSLRSAFSHLLDNGALKTHPAQMLEAQLLMIRAHREHAGGLLVDFRESARKAWAAMREVDPTIGPFDPPPQPAGRRQTTPRPRVFPDG